MKTDFSINVQVNLGVTPELAAMVSAILAHRPQKSEGTLAARVAQPENAPDEQQPPAPKEEAAASQATTAKRGRKKKDQEPPRQEQEPPRQEQETEPQTKEKHGSEEEEAAANRAVANADGSERHPEEQPKYEKRPKPEEQPMTEEQPKQGETAKAAKPVTEEDVRAAMHRARLRIEGEDYRDNVTGERYQKYHKALTAWFKNMASVLGSDKPSTLPESMRVTFIKQCDELKIMEDGTIGSDVPF